MGGFGLTTFPEYWSFFYLEVRVKKKSKQNRLFLACLGIMLIFSYPIAVSAQAQIKPRTQDEMASAIEGGFEYIATQMNPDGGIRWVDDASSVATTLRAVWALAAGGYSQDYLQHETGKRPIDFLAIHGADWVDQADFDTPGFNVARAGQLLTAIAAANQNPHRFSDNSRDFIYEIRTLYDPNTGVFGNSTPENVLDQVWAIIGLAANNASIPTEAVDWLSSAQLPDGSWNDGYGSYLDTTPLAIMALISSEHREVDAPEILMAMDFLKNNQQPNGGWQTEWDTTSNASTTGTIVQAIKAVGQAPMSVDWQQGEANPQKVLLSLQQEDGAIGGDFTNAYSTADAILGLSGKWITRLGHLQNASEAIDFMISMRELTGGWGSIGQTVDVLLALHAAGWLPNTVTADNASPLESFSENLEAYLESGPDAIGKAMIGLVALGENPLDYEGLDLSQRLKANYDDSSQAFGSPTNTWHQAFSILGLYATGVDIPQGVVDRLIGLQQDDGGWEYTPGFGTWPDNTALAIQALLAAGHPSDSTEIQSAKDYLRTMQEESGGWGDSSTTAYVITALNALNEPLENWITDAGKMPTSDLFSYQKYNGAFVYSWESPEDNVMSTASALLGILGGDFIIRSEDNPPINYAAVFIDPGDEKVQSACVAFAEAGISGLELLDASGFPYEIQDGFINQIINISNQEGETNYWSFWHWNGRDWEFYNSGISDTRIYPGSIQAWTFTSWERFPSLPPDFIPNINQVCAVNVLVNYEDQPFIDFNQIFLESFNAREFAEPIIKPLDAETAQSPLPESLLIALGSIFIVIMIVLLIKKRK
jgi:prenyltransferase beta subunit